jgi:hypothetical protein
MVGVVLCGCKLAKWEKSRKSKTYGRFGPQRCRLEDERHQKRLKLRADLPCVVLCVALPWRAGLGSACLGQGQRARSLDLAE